jgi:UDP-xylose/UDP-N-acetylglucosamine transporter B4
VRSTPYFCISLTLLPSNACALELFVADYPHAGTLSTFAQFTLISLIGLTRNLTCDKSVPATHFLAQLHTVLRNRRDIRILVRTNEQDKLLLASFIDDLTGLILSKSPETSVLSVPLRDLSTLSLSNVSNEAVFSTLSALPSSQHSNSSTRTKPDNPTSHKIVVVHGSNTSAQLDHITWDVCLRIENESTVFLSSRSVYFLSHPNTISEPPLGVHRSKYSFYDPALPPWWQLWNVRLKRPSIPIRSWIMQVILFFAVSLLNNLAFGYRVPMPIHIVFRSGGSVVNMIIGWMSGRR